MRAAVIGGKLQGIEAAYLAHKVNWGVVAVDQNEAAPVRELADLFYCFDIFEPGALQLLLQEVDFVIPAIEHAPALEYIYRTARQLGKKIMYTPAAYAISSSKKRSDKLFHSLGIPAPAVWPDCQLPLILKPSGGSGSHGVQKLYTEREFKTFCFAHKDWKSWVIQEFLDGPSYSIEIVAQNGFFRTFQVTELEMDEIYDCKRVLAPANLPAELMQRFSDCAVRLAQAVKLDGIMDVEVILHEGELKVLEIDARLPSQTLTAVIKSTGINPLRVYEEGLKEGSASEYTMLRPRQHVLYEHILVTRDKIKVCGEHIMAGRGPLHYQQDFFGAGEALTSYNPREKQKEWAATLVLTASSREAARAKEQLVIHNIMQAAGVHCYEDFAPGD